MESILELGVIGVIVAAGIYLWQRYAPDAAVQRLATLQQHATMLVEAAEQMQEFAGQPSEKKLDWVSLQLQLHFPGVDAMLIRAAIEQAVRLLGPKDGEA